MARVTDVRGPTAQAIWEVAESLDTDPATVRKAQMALKVNGYYLGKVDGIAGPSTVSAARLFDEVRREQGTEQLRRDEWNAMADSASERQAGDGGDVRIVAGSTGPTGGEVYFSGFESTTPNGSRSPVLAPAPPSAPPLGVVKDKPRRRFRFQEENNDDKE